MLPPVIQNNKKIAALLTGLLLAGLLYGLNPLALEEKARLVLSTGVLMITWWVLDAMPLPVVALMPLILFPLTGVKSLKETAPDYSDPVIYLFMGGFMIGLAIEKWNLHKRIALNIIKITGSNGNRIILGFIIATGFLSMWLSNTATTMMMFPIALSVIQVTGNGSNGQGNMRHFSLALMLCVAYASNLGGIATIIGTPPNVSYIGQLTATLGKHSNLPDGVKQVPGFLNWMLLCTPLAIILLMMLYLLLVKMFPNHIKASAEGRMFINSELQRLGPLSTAEKRVLAVFITTALLWIFKDLLIKIPGVRLDDYIIALLGAVALFIIPSGANTEDREERLLAWGDTSKMAWGILVLFGGGMALAKAFEEVKLTALLGDYLAKGAPDNLFLLILLVTTISVFLSEVMSNVAQVMVLTPVVTELAVSLNKAGMVHVTPLLLGIPMTLGASCAGMLPMGTPPNAIVFSSGHIPLPKMLRAGFVLNIICILLISVFCWLLIPLIRF